MQRQHPKSVRPAAGATSFPAETIGAHLHFLRDGFRRLLPRSRPSPADFSRTRAGKRKGEIQRPAQPRAREWSKRGAWVLFCVHHAAAALPADLNDFAVLNEKRDGERGLSQLSHSLARPTVSFNVELGELASFPLKPFAHFAGVGAAGRAVELQIRHGRAPPAPRGADGKSRLALPGYAECNRTERSTESPRGRGAGLRRRRNRAAPRGVDSFFALLPARGRYVSSRRWWKWRWLRRLAGRGRSTGAEKLIRCRRRWRWRRDSRAPWKAKLREWTPIRPEA